MVPRRTGVSDPALPTTGPDASVMRALRTFGAKEVEIPGAPSWWIIPGHEHAMTWREAVEWMAQCAKPHVRDKPPHKTPEFWFAAASFFGIAGTAITTLIDTGFGGPLAPYLMPIAGVLAAVVPIGYRFATARGNRLAAQEREDKRHAHQSLEKDSHAENSGPSGRREHGP